MDTVPSLHTWAGILHGLLRIHHAPVIHPRDTHFYQLNIPCFFVDNPCIDPIDSYFLCSLHKAVFPSKVLLINSFAQCLWLHKGVPWWYSTPLISKKGILTTPLCLASTRVLILLCAKAMQPAKIWNMGHCLCILHTHWHTMSSPVVKPVFL